MVDKGITIGTNKTTTSLGATCSKTQILTHPWRTNGSPDPTAAKPLIKPADYFYEAALRATEKGLVSGFTFGTNVDCSRIMTMGDMWKAAESSAPVCKADFTDAPDNANYAQVVAWAVENKITSGTGSGHFFRHRKSLI